MRRALLASSLLAVALLAPTARAAAPEPTAVVQLLPLNKCLADIKVLLRQADGPGEDGKLVKEMEKDLEAKLGEKGFEGLDLNRPLAAYVDVPADLAKTVAVLVLPITTEKEFLGLLERLNAKVTEVDGRKGLYKVEGFPLAEDPLPARLRFAEGHAYLSVNDPDGAALDPARLPAVEVLVRPAEAAHVALRLDLGRVPKAAVEEQVKKLKEMAREASFAADGATPMGKLTQRFAEKGSQLVARYAEALLRDGKEFGLRFGLDADQGFFYELALTPKPGSALARDVAARKSPVSALAGAIGPDSAAYYFLQLPYFAPEVGEIADAGFAAWAANIQEVPDALVPAVQEAFKGLGRTAKACAGDIAVVLNGPNKEGHYTAFGGLSFEDPTAVETALREALKAQPEVVQKLVALNADKAGAVGLHRFTVGEALPEEARKAFGPNAVGCVAFAPKAIYFGFGPDAVAAVKAAVTAAPKPAKAVDAGIAPRKLLPLIKLFNPNVTLDDLKAAQPDVDELKSIGSFTVVGGEELKLVWAGRNFNLLRILKPDDDE